MIANRRMREDLEDFNANYQELITTSNELLRIKRVTRQHNEEFIGQNKELQIKIQSMNVEHSRYK